MKRLIVLLGFCLSTPSVVAQAPAPTELERNAAEGQKALGERRWADAARAYERLRELSPETAEVHAQLGMIYFQQNDFARAVPPLRQAQKLKPGLPNVDVLLAMCLSELGQFKEAVPGLQKGFGQSADASLRRISGLQLQRTYTGLAQDDKAVEVALQLTRLYKDDPEILYHSGRLISNYAYLLTMRLAEVAPASVWMHQAAGEANESIKNYDSALEEYQKVLALVPGRPGVHFRLGRVYLARARPPFSEADAEAHAAREFEQELAIDPTNADAAYELGELARKAGELDKARELFAAAVKHYPEFEEGLVGLGRVLVAQGKAELALAPLKKAVAINPKDDVAHFQIYQAYRALGQGEAAQKAQAEFQRLRAQKREAERRDLLRAHVVTQQELDAELKTTPP
jgi:tetratricopeptide (TPR) repeat protein